ncbi:squalene synthase HpnC [Kribbella solani]|uniref:squalene synthase HpnC n=1 Tax=Kribbella solani TaxID=236067 RepID=UPI0029BE53FB|nr:squalene synthase HpnC [Kribbella solani]MDX2974100.1 squalene synthase HpnC [Kribbella solani]MDX3006200.1 squalene synthase HpnC [Kribbella solani]
MHPDGLQKELGRREQSENFPVVLKVLPGAPRAGLHAIYGYARTVDELGDSFPGDRTAALHAFAADLDRIWAGEEPDHPVLRRLRRVVQDHNLEPDPFRRLILANLQDQTVTRYQTFEDLAGYCRLSADPVGRMVLGVFGVNDPETERLSDLVCTALQLVEHWQDVAEDRRAGRIYLPQEDLTTYGVPESDLDQPTASAALRELMSFETDRAARLLDEGAAIVGRLHGWARLSVAGFVAGGQATVRALRRTGGDVLSHQARPSKADTLRLLLKAVAR